MQGQESQQTTLKAVHQEGVAQSLRVTLCGLRRLNLSDLMINESNQIRNKFLPANNRLSNSLEVARVCILLLAGWPSAEAVGDQSRDNRTFPLRAL